MARMVIPTGDTLSEATMEIYQINQEKGWHEEGRTVTDYVALIMTELAEAVEEYRKGLGFHDIHYTVKLDQTRPMTQDPVALSGLRKVIKDKEFLGDDEGPTEAEWTAMVMAGIAKPEGVAVEFMDAVIRILDALGSEGVDVQNIYDLKIAYNKTRPYRHGGKRL